MAKRSKHFTFIMYPESSPSNWKELLKSTHIRSAVSPLHDKDLNPTGDEKKPHYHVMLEYDSLKSYDQVIDFLGEIFLGGYTIPQIVQSPVGMIRYFIHKDNPEKHQYNWADISVYNGFDLSKFDSYTENEIDHIISEITIFIDDNNILEYADLLATVRDPDYGHFEDWYRIIRKNTLLFNTYITSRRNQYKEWKKNKSTEMRSK